MATSPEGTDREVRLVLYPEPCVKQWEPVSPRVLSTFLKNLSFHHLLCNVFVWKQSKPKDIPFTVMCDKEKQKFPSLEKLKVAAFLVGKIKGSGWFSDNRVIDRLIAAALNNSALIKLQ